MGYYVKFKLVIARKDINNDILRLIDVYEDELDYPYNVCFFNKRLDQEYVYFDNRNWNNECGSKSCPGKKLYDYLDKNDIKYNYIELGEDNVDFILINKLDKYKLGFSRLIEFDDEEWA